MVKLIVNWFLTEAPREFDEEKIIFSANGAGAIGYPQAKACIYIVTSHHTQNTFQMDRRPKCKS